METSRYLQLLVFLTFNLLAFAGCAELNDPYYPQRGGGYYDPPRHDDYDRRDWEHDRRERHEIERERDRLEDERRELERERSRDRYTPPPPPRHEERCPSGFSPSEQKCSVEERRRGCKDMRLPGGLGCVRR